MFSPSPSKLTATIPGTQRISPRRQRLNVGKIPKQRYDHQNSHKPNVQGICRPFMRLKISASSFVRGVLSRTNGKPKPRSREIL